MSTLPKTPLTAEQYLEIERKAEFKSEFYRGETFAMSGGSSAHSALAFDVGLLIGLHVRGKGCRVYTSDLRVLVEETGLYTYPDLSVVCGGARFSDSHQDTLVNPILLVEVLSPSTEQYDRGTKVKLYRAIPSLQECLLISQTAPEIELYRRKPDGWSLIEAKGMDASIELTSIGFLLSLRELYRETLPASAVTA